jgi:hypothetical protein
MDNKEVGVQLGYCRITKTRTKFFFQQDGKEIEFYIDRDPSTSMATLWIRPGYTEAVPQFIAALVLNSAQAQEAEKGLTSK